MTVTQRHQIRARAYTHTQAQAHTLRVRYSHHCRQSLTRASRLPLPLPGYRAWICGGGGKARWLRISGRSRGAAQGGAHGFWARCAQLSPRNNPACLPESSAPPFLTGLGARKPGSFTVLKFCDPTPPPGFSLSSQGLWRGR